MSVLMSIAFAFLLLYAGLTGWLALGFLRSRRFTKKQNKAIPVSIIICARNEEKNIGGCLTSIVKQDYDKKSVQVILVNDASSDATLKVAQGVLASSGLDYRIISNDARKGKKQSIALAMEFAAHELVITRDADTISASAGWLQSIASFYSETKADMIIAPVGLVDNSGIMWALQALENNILLLFACGSAYFKKPFLCSGANLAFTQQAFVKAGSYKSHLHIDSGDDVLFMEDLKRIPGSKIAYLKAKDALVLTFPCYSLAALIHQKTRWAAKFKVNKNSLNMSLAAVSFFTNLAWLFCLLYGFMQPLNNSLALVFVFCKLLIDFLLLFLASGFVRNKLLLWYSLPVGCVYPLYACVVGVSSFFIKPKWKA
jgi:cellulose synthase/poly-beta-1,6-N-acetylglucosamine synthase-like glycosyltransferase